MGEYSIDLLGKNKNTGQGDKVMMQEKQNERFMEQKEQKVQKNVSQISFQKTNNLEKTANFEKELRKPRSKKRMQVLQSVDLPSMTDEEIIERMMKESGEDLDAENITQEDICAYLARCEAEFIESVQKVMAEEEERRQEEERKKQEEERKRQLQKSRDEKRLVSCLCKCYISGCVVHAINRKGGWGGVEHFSKNKIPEKYQKAYKLYTENSRCNCVEIYEEYMVSITSNGEVIKVVKTQEV